MVHSRSETNLDRIFFDLCTSSEVQCKHKHTGNNRRQHLPPLPTLTSARSNSCSNLNEPLPNSNSQPILSSSSFDDYHTEEREESEVPSTVQLPASERKESAQIQTLEHVPLMPMESQGFTVQAPTYSTNRSISLFETQVLPTIDDKNKKTTEQYSSFSTQSSIVETVSGDNTKNQTSSSSSNEWTNQDYINRLSHRLKSRTHLRKFFLS